MLAEQIAATDQSGARGGHGGGTAGSQGKCKGKYR
jgi:hypothetical protein